jgi:hypothetical protein
MNTFGKRVAVVLLAATLVSSACMAAKPVSLTAVQCFTDMDLGGLVPISVEISNSGDSTSGVVQVRSSSYGASSHVYTYPVDLPAGTRKRIVAYPLLPEDSQSVDVSFSAPGISTHVDVKNDNADDNANLTVGVISDSLGSLSAIRPSQTEVAAISSGQQSSAPLYRDCYVTPENAPDRALGYNGVTVLAAGDGAERLNDDQWRAVRQWVLGGGSLLLLGGPGCLGYLQSEIPSGLSPLQDLHVTTLPHLTLPKSFCQSSTTPIAVATGAPKPGADVLVSQNGAPLLSTIRYGAGEVMLVGFDPTASEFNGAGAKRELLGSLVSCATGGIGRTAIQELINSRLTSTANEGTVRTGNHTTNPFAIHLPKAGVLGAIFLAYFLLAIPMTYFVLRKLDKLQWAWLTGPALGVGFALVLALYTITLYKSGFSRRTAGVVFSASRSPDARGSGGSEVFFPRAGQYDVAVPGAEMLETNQQDDESNAKAATAQDTIETTDIAGSVIAAGYQVTNLAFRRFFHSEPVSIGQGLKTQIQKSGDKVTITMTNLTGVALGSVVVAIPGTSGAKLVGDLRPGETVTSTWELSKSDALFAVSQAPPDDLVFLVQAMKATPLPVSQASSAQCAYVVASFPASVLGPQLGTDVSQPNSVSLLVSCPIGGVK